MEIPYLSPEEQYTNEMIIANYKIEPDTEIDYPEQGWLILSVEIKTGKNGEYKLLKMRNNSHTKINSIKTSTVIFPNHAEYEKAKQGIIIDGYIHGLDGRESFTDYSKSKRLMKEKEYFINYNGDMITNE